MSSCCRPPAPPPPPGPGPAGPGAGSGEPGPGPEPGSEAEARAACGRAGLAAVRWWRWRARGVRRALQAGPTCGAVALWLALQDAARSSPARLAAAARAAGYSASGEMFSCRDMLALAQASAPHVACSLRRDGLAGEALVAELLDGATLLVPYDSDFNHAPCLRRGHRAHWAFISGVVVVCDPQSDPSPDHHNVYVLANHGKSLHLAAWPLADLAASNDNLWEFPPQREVDGLNYVVPPGGVAGDAGLRSQYIVLQPHRALESMSCDSHQLG